MSLVVCGRLNALQSPSRQILRTRLLLSAVSKRTFDLQAPLTSLSASAGLSAPPLIASVPRGPHKPRRLCSDPPPRGRQHRADCMRPQCPVQTSLSPRCPPRWNPPRATSLAASRSVPTSSAVHSRHAVTGSPGKLYNPHPFPVRRPVMTIEDDSMSDAASSSSPRVMLEL